MTQNKIAKRWGWSQPAVSYYLNGLLKLNTDAVLQFAVSLDVDPVTIDPRLTAFMRYRPPHPVYGHKITLDTNEYAPKLSAGDTIAFDPASPPRLGALCIVCTSPTQIGYYTENGQLHHPITHKKQTILGECLAHPIKAICPAPLETVTC